jgi:small-conductance mechanosensitive channel
MSDILTLNFAFILITVLLICVLYCLVYALKVNARLNKSINLINDLYKLSTEQGQILKQLSQEHSQADLQRQSDAEKKENHLNQTLADVQARVSGLEGDLLRVSNQTEQLMQTDPATKMYSRANQLAASNASIDDIVEACGLPRAEVEVLMGLHRKK